LGSVPKDECSRSMRLLQNAQKQRYPKTTVHARRGQ
jgi:hypothetical protein